MAPPKDILHDFKINKISGVNECRHCGLRVVSFADAPWVKTQICPTLDRRIVIRREEDRGREME